MLGPHIVGGISSREAILKRWKPRVALLLDPSQGEAKRFKQLAPGAFLIGRVFEEDSKIDQRIAQNPENAAEWAADHIRAVAHLNPEIDVWQFNNEVQSDNLEQILRLTRFTISYIDLLAQAGLRAAIGGFAVGKPQLWSDADGGASWHAFFEAMRHGMKHNAVLLLHAYGQGPRPSDNRGPLFSSREWLLRRFEEQVVEMNRLPDDLRTMPYVYGEMGVSKGADGWRTFYNNNAQAYVNDLVEQAHFLAQQPNCLGACVFTWGGATFGDKDINGEVAERLADRIAKPIGPAAAPMRAPVLVRSLKVDIEGTVMLEGMAVESATVQLIGTNEQLGRLRRPNRMKSLREEHAVTVTTNAQGEFAIPQIPSGHYRIEIKVAGAQPFVRSFDCTTARKLEIDLQRLEVFPMLAAAQPLSTKRKIECGINIDPSNTAGNPSAAQLRELGAEWVRLVFRNNDDSKLAESFAEFDRVVDRLNEVGVSVLLIVNNESVSGKPDRSQLENAEVWHAYIARFTNRCRQVAQHFGARIAALQIWNEPDHPGHEGYDPTVLPHLYGSMLRQSFEAIKSVSTVTVVTAGMAWGDPGWVRSMMAATNNQLFADVLCVHPYSRRPAAEWPNPTWGGLGDVNLLDLMRAYRKTTSKPIWITEFGTDDRTTKVTENGSTVLAHDLFPQQFFEAINRHLSEFIPRAFWFCWSDGMVNNFGVVNKEGQKQGAFSSFHLFANLPKTVS